MELYPRPPQVPCVRPSHASPGPALASHSESESEAWPGKASPHQHSMSTECSAKYLAGAVEQDERQASSVDTTP